MGSPIPTDGVAAYVAAANPENACEEVSPPPTDFGNNGTKWFLLTKRFGCSFLAKVNKLFSVVSPQSDHISPSSDEVCNEGRLRWNDCIQC